MHPQGRAYLIVADEQGTAVCFEATLYRCQERTIDPLLIGYDRFL